MQERMSRFATAFALNRKSAIWISGWLAITLMTTEWLLHSQNNVLAFVILLAAIVGCTSMPIATGWKFLGTVVAALLILPYAAGGNGNFMDLGSQMGLYVVLALGLNVVVGFAGLLDLGFIAFFGSGAYLYGIFASTQAQQFLPNLAAHFPLSGHWFWLFLPAGLLLGAILGILLGLPVLRVHGDYLAIVTLGFGEIIQILLNNLESPINITNGPQGVIAISPPQIGAHVFGKPVDYYFIVAALVIITLFVINRMEHSKFGRAWTAVRDDQLAAQAMGVPLVRTKLIAFATGASFAGMMGAVYAAKASFIDPTSFDYMQSVLILVMVILGGSGSIRGVVIGALSVTLIQFELLPDLSQWLQALKQAGTINLPSQLDPAQSQRLLFGIILILMTLFRPKGIIAAKRRYFDLDKIKDAGILDRLKVARQKQTSDSPPAKEGSV